MVIYSSALKNDKTEAALRIHLHSFLRWAGLARRRARLQRAQAVSSVRDA